MTRNHVLVELDAEPWPLGRDYVAVLPHDRPLEELRIEPAPRLDALEQEKVRRAGGELDVRRSDDGAAVEVRRDLRVAHLRHAGDLLRLEQPPDAAEVHLKDRGSAGLE